MPLLALNSPYWPLLAVIKLRHSPTFFSAIGFERSQQLRGDRSGAVAIEDCWLWQMMAENLFSKTIICQRQRFATANNSHTQISHPKRHRLNEALSEHKSRRLFTSRLDFVGAEGFEPPTLCL